MNTNPVIGVVIIARHGDRLGFFQSPTNYISTTTTLTTLGEQQSFQLGSTLRSIYANDTSPNRIQGLNIELLDSTQYTSIADGGGEGGVLYDSAQALWQGFYPPNLRSTQQLANGTNITSPLGGFQYVLVDSVLPEDDISLEPWVSCPTWTENTAALYASPAYAAKAAVNAPFLASLAANNLVGGRNSSFVNMWNVFDYMNVQNIHNATYAAQLAASGPSTLGQARDLANWSEYHKFTSPILGGIGNIAGQTFLHEILHSLEDFTNATKTTKIAHYQIAYKPFLSIFNMTNIRASTPPFPNPEGIVDYASVATLELRNNMANNGYDVRFAFRNGSQSGDPIPYSLFGSSSIDTDLKTFTDNFSPSLVTTTTEWCNVCNQGTLRGCSAELALQSTTTKSTSMLSNVGAGFIGAVVTLALGALLLFLMIRMGIASFSRSGRSRKRNDFPLGDSTTHHITGSRAQSFVSH